MTDTPTPAPLVPSQRAIEPCPFCGKPPRMCPDTSYGAATVFCPDDNHCPVSPAADADLEDGQTLEDAITAWNTRAERSNPGADVERLRAALRLARPIVEADHEQAKDMKDADWEGISSAALSAIDEALATPTRAENAKCPGMEERAREIANAIRHLPDCEMLLDLGPRVYSCACDREHRAILAALSAQNEDTLLLSTLRDESWDLRCFPVPTGGGDADIGWRVVGHWMAEPAERTVAEVYHDDPRAAIREALSAQSGGER